MLGHKSTVTNQSVNPGLLYWFAFGTHREWNVLQWRCYTGRQRRSWPPAVAYSPTILPFLLTAVLFIVVTSTATLLLANISLIISPLCLHKLLFCARGYQAISRVGGGGSKQAFSFVLTKYIAVF